MTKLNSPPNARLDENLVKTALAALDWGILKRHFDDIGLTDDHNRHRFGQQFIR